MIPVVPRGTHRLSKPERFEVFGNFAKYQPECSRSGSDRYQICVGRYVGGTFFSSDTLDLYVKFEAWVKKQRRKDRDGVARPWRIWDSAAKRSLTNCYSSRESAASAADRLNGPYFKRFKVKEKI